MTSPLSEEKLAELRKLHEAATPGPWAWEPTGEKDNSWGLGVVEDDDGNLVAGHSEPGANEVIDPVCEAIDGRGADAALIAAMRNALPELLDALDAGREIAQHNHDELVAANQEIDRLRAERDDALELAHQDHEHPVPSEVLRERLEQALVAATRTLPSGHPLGAQRARYEAIEALLPVITAEVSARVSEAQVAVPEPVFVGEVTDAPEEPWTVGPVTLFGQLVVEGSLIDGTKVGIWPASLAEQVADRELDNEGLSRELDAMTAVAKRLYEGWAAYVPDDDDKGLWTKGVIPDGYEAEYEEWMTDSERRALQLLSEGESE